MASNDIQVSDEQSLVRTSGGRISLDEGLELIHIPGLHVNRARACEAADQALPRLETGQTTATLIMG